ncbi:hypothetical protein [Microbacterium sp. NPDC076895]|uniref:hypothetical protein n=1 Tax=Microbacterium sp. NPDC076895 TaxID=3154957 RepID=UPI0034260C0A
MKEETKPDSDFTEALVEEVVGWPKDEQEVLKIMRGIINRLNSGGNAGEWDLWEHGSAMVAYIRNIDPEAIDSTYLWPDFEGCFIETAESWPIARASTLGLFAEWIIQRAGPDASISEVLADLNPEYFREFMKRMRFVRYAGGIHIFRM